MATDTLEKAHEQAREAREANREIGVISYTSAQKQSDKVYEVKEGYKHLPGGIRLGPGNRFHPTEKQVADGSLKGKAEEIRASEYRDLTRSKRPDAKPRAPGADIGIRRFEMAPTTLTYAIEQGLTEDDFEGVEPEGSDGRYTHAQVEAMVEAREAPDA